MKFLIPLLFFAYLAGCSTFEGLGGPMPEWAQFHSKEYPCPKGTIKIGDPRFRNQYWSCENVWIREGYPILIPRR